MTTPTTDTSDKFICPDCGYSQPRTAQDSYQICDSCFKENPDPLTGWPVAIRWAGPKKGRGVYVVERVSKGTLVERCHAIPFSVKESVALGNTLPTLARYVFPWPTGRKAFLSGCGLLYNYDTPKVTGKSPTVRATIRRGLLAVEFHALRDLMANEEVTFDYRDIRVYKG